LQLFGISDSRLNGGTFCHIEADAAMAVRLGQR
jgi:hypothetical protein